MTPLPPHYFACMVRIDRRKGLFRRAIIYLKSDFNLPTALYTDSVCFAGDYSCTSALGLCIFLNIFPFN